MSKIDEVILVAASQVGYKEGKNNASKYGTWYGLPNQPWCAMFVSWCFSQAGALAALPGGKYASCSAMTDRFKKAGRWYTNPQIGDCVFFTFGHTGIVTGIVTGGVITIEGNTQPGTGGNQGNGDGVYRRTRTASIAGYGRPDWAKVGVTNPVTAVTTATGLKVDGIWGDATTRAFQTMLRKRGAQLSVDGCYGPASCLATQTLLGTVRDKVVSGQPFTARRWCPGWAATVWDKTTKGGSLMVAALANRIKTAGYPVGTANKDGQISKTLVEGVQRWLNAGRTL